MDQLISLMFQVINRGFIFGPNVSPFNANFISKVRRKLSPLPFHIYVVSEMLRVRAPKEIELLGYLKKIGNAGSQTVQLNWEEEKNGYLRTLLWLPGFLTCVIAVYFLPLSLEIRYAKSWSFLCFILQQLLLVVSKEFLFKKVSRFLHL